MMSNMLDLLKTLLVVFLFNVLVMAGTFTLLRLGII